MIFAMLNTVAGRPCLHGNDWLPDPRPEERSTFEAMGIVFKERVEENPSFVHAVLPPGWQKKATDLPYWTNVVDGRGLARATIFWGERMVMLMPCCRFRVRLMEETGRLFARIVDDSDRVVYETPAFSFTPETIYACRTRAHDTAKDWANRHMPRWKDHSAYWDDVELNELSMEPSQQ